MQATEIMPTECHVIIKIRVIIIPFVAGGYADRTLKTTCLFDSLPSDKASFGAGGTFSFINLLTHQALIAQYVLTVDTQGILGLMALLQTRAVTRPLPPMLISRGPSAGVPDTAAVIGETLALLQEKWVKQGKKGPFPMEKAGRNSPRKSRF